MATPSQSLQICNQHNGNGDKNDENVPNISHSLISLWTVFGPNNNNNNRTQNAKVRDARGSSHLFRLNKDLKWKTIIIHQREWAALTLPQITNQRPKIRLLAEWFCGGALNSLNQKDKNKNNKNQMKMKQCSFEYSYKNKYIFSFFTVSFAFCTHIHNDHEYEHIEISMSPMINQNNNTTINKAKWAEENKRQNHNADYFLAPKSIIRETKNDCKFYLLSVCLSHTHIHYFSLCHTHEHLCVA